MKIYKCPHCKREFAKRDDIVLVMCVCGNEAVVQSKVKEDDEDGRE